MAQQLEQVKARPPEIAFQVFQPKGAIEEDADFMAWRQLQFQESKEKPTTVEYSMYRSIRKPKPSPYSA